VEIGELRFELDNAVMGARYVACAPRAGAMPLDSRDGGLSHFRMPTHAKVVI
jgi:hypothetical protein